MVVSIVIGVVMSFAGGMTLDTMIDGFTGAGVFDVPPEWNSVGRVNMLINIYFALMYLIPVIGIGVFVVTILKRQRYDRYGDPYDTYEGR